MLQRVDFRVRLAYRDPWLQAGQSKIVEIAHRLLQLALGKGHGQQCLDRSRMIALRAGEAVDVRQTERRGHYPNHDIGEAIQGNGLSQDPWVSLKLCPPKAVHENCNTLLAPLGFLRRNSPAEQ